MVHTLSQTTRRCTSQASPRDISEPSRKTSQRGQKNIMGWYCQKRP